jgi:hypothetical protein
MKKISTLVLAGLLTVSAFAADRRPSVTVETNRKYEIVIDGKSYSANYGGMINITSLREGKHNITVYAANQGFFFRKIKKMVSTSNFTLRGNDIRISVDQFGKLQIKESRFGNGKDNGGWDKNDRDHDRNDHGGRF